MDQSAKEGLFVTLIRCDPCNRMVMNCSTFCILSAVSIHRMQCVYLVELCVCLAGFFLLFFF